jgi:FkbM family methyltransferase
MNFDDALKHYLPRLWFRFRFFKYKHLGRGEPELRLIRHLVAPGTTAIDVGASIGIYAAEMARYAGKVLAFEANPQVAAFARKVAARKIEVVETALSSRAGRTTLTMPADRKGNPTTELATLEPNQRPDARLIAIEVGTRRLDDFPVTNCSFIKIDVEGHEEEVLDGATALIGAQRPALMIELVEQFNPGVVARLRRRLAAQSYGAFFLSGGRLKPIAEFDAARDQSDASGPAREFIVNFLFVPDNGLASIAGLVVRPSAGS